jgi:hypothetical protein
MSGDLRSASREGLWPGYEARIEALLIHTICLREHVLVRLCGNWLCFPFFPVRRKRRPRLHPHICRRSCRDGRVAFALMGEPRTYGLSVTYNY